MICEIIENKKKYLPLLLLADEQESMIESYLNRGTMYVLEEQDVKVVCVVTDEGQEEGKRILEIKNLAVAPESQKKGYGRAMIEFVKKQYTDSFDVLQAGTGDSPLTIPFYEKCGFRKSHVMKNFFVDNYDHPIYEEGIQLVDMIYLRMNL